jgi:hypothetical protein
VRIGCWHIEFVRLVLEMAALGALDTHPHDDLESRGLKRVGDQAGIVARVRERPDVDVRVIPYDKG